MLVVKKSTEWRVKKKRIDNMVTELVRSILNYLGPGTGMNGLLPLVTVLAGVK